MSRDLLDEATRALRESAEGDDASAEFTRARVMAGLHTGTVRRRTRVAFLLPLAATFAAASAWGVSSESGRAFLQDVGESLGLTQAREPSPPSLSAPVEKPGRVSQTAPGVAPAVSEQEPELEQEPETPEAAPVEAPVKLEPPRRAASSSPAPSASSAATEREIELYRAAHRAHFVDKDFATALAAWDRYLRGAPSGRFVLEARYNRALCLLRLGRGAEARAALAPFARGDYDGYRQREAGELLGALAE